MPEFCLFWQKTNRKYHHSPGTNTPLWIINLLIIKALRLICPGTCLDIKNATRILGHEKQFIFLLPSFIIYNTKRTSKIIFSYIDRLVHKLSLAFFVLRNVSTTLLAYRRLIWCTVLIICISPEGHYIILLKACHTHAFDAYIKFKRYSCHLSLGV